MAINVALVGRKYGPFRYEVGLERAREFAVTVSGGVPSSGFMGAATPQGLHPWLHDAEAAKKSPYKGLIAMPNFAVVFAMAAFGAACGDPELGVNLLMLVHGEQELEWHEVIKPGDVMSTTGVVSEIYSKQGKDFLKVTTESRNQNGKLVVVGTWLAIIRNEAGPVEQSR